MAGCNVVDVVWFSFHNGRKYILRIFLIFLQLEYNPQPIYRISKLQIFIFGFVIVVGFCGFLVLFLALNLTKGDSTQVTKYLVVRFLDVFFLLGIMMNCAAWKNNCVVQVESV